MTYYYLCRRRGKWILNWISTTLECEQAAEQVLVILERPCHV